MSANAVPDPPDGAGLRALLAATAAYLEANAPFLDALNVYPVPDGDTGSNMSATFGEAVATAAALGPAASVEEVLGALARGALYGARGNSGVILSQALRGFAEGGRGALQFDGATLIRCLEAAARLSYEAVANPVEGTMLTVTRVAAERAAAAGITEPGGPCELVLRAALAGAEEAEAETPSLLRALAEAGVTDAGGEGICVLLRGLLAGLTGAVPPPPQNVDRPIATLAGHEAERFGFCTEFIIEPRAGETLDSAGVRAAIEAGDARSLVVVGDASALRVHVHTGAPEALLAAVGAFGTLHRTKIDDMTAQHTRFTASGGGASAKVAVLAMSPGPGFDDLFASLGVATTRLKEVEKPSAQEIAAAANRLGSADVIILTNHANVVMAARQSAAIARCTVTVVETESVPQGLAAALAFTGEASAANAAESMRKAMRAVRTVEVTIAAADRTTAGVDVRSGEAIALVDGRLVASTGSLLEALLAGLDAAGASAAGLVSVYGGARMTEAELAALRMTIEGRYARAAVEVLPGGQELYPYIASVEA